MGIGDLTKLLGQFKDIQANFQKAQEELKARTVEASSGGGMVTAKVNGKGDLLDIKIDKGAVDTGDIEMLEDLIRAAVNAAQAKGQELAQQQLSGMFGGINLPGLENITQFLK